MNRITLFVSFDIPPNINELIILADGERMLRVYLWVKLKGGRIKLYVYLCKCCVDSVYNDAIVALNRSVVELVRGSLFHGLTVGQRVKF